MKVASAAWVLFGFLAVAAGVVGTFVQLWNGDDWWLITALDWAWSVLVDGLAALKGGEPVTT